MFFTREDVFPPRDRGESRTIDPDSGARDRRTR